MFADYTTLFENCKDATSSNLTNLKRFVVGFSAIFGSISKIAKTFDISKRYVYNLKECTEKFCTSFSEKPIEALQELFHKLIPDLQICLADKKFFRFLIISLAVDAGASLEGIQRVLENVFQHHISIGEISNILNQAADRAAEFDATISLANIQQGANDEIFQGDMPIFTGVDTVTGYTYLLKAKNNRSADTWQSAMEECKEKGLDLKVSISDCGTGLLSGIPKAFPNAQIQTDLFHWLMELGKAVSSMESKVMSELNDYYQCKQSSLGQKVHKKTLEKLEKIEERLPIEIEQYDKINMLYQWLKELTRYQGISYKESLSLCQWIISEMEKSEGITNKFKKILKKTRKNLPQVLVYLKRADEALKRRSQEEGYSEDVYTLMYRLLQYQSNSMEYKAIYKRLVKILKDNFANVYFEVMEILDSIKRASSPVENLNGRLRKYINLKRIVPEKFLTLLKVYFNTRKSRRSRIEERIGKSPLELLTGQAHRDFYEIVCA